MEGSPCRVFGSRSLSARSYARTIHKVELQRRWSGAELPVEAKAGEALRRHCLLKAAKAALMAVEGQGHLAPVPPVDPSARTLVIDLECLCSNVCFYDRTQGFVQRVLPRPHVRLFLESVRAHFRLAVWSSRSRAWMSCALTTLDPAHEFLDFRSQLAVAAGGVDYETEGLPTILDDGQGVDPSDVVVVTLCRAAFGSLADSVIEVPPYDVHAGGATGQGFDTVLLSLAALLVRHLGIIAAEAAAGGGSTAADSAAGCAERAGTVAADAGVDASEQRVLRLEGEGEGSSGSGTAAGDADVVAAPVAQQRRPVREELRRLGLSDTRFGEGALGLLGGECPAAVSYVLEDMAPQRNPHAPQPHGRLHAGHAASRAAAAAAAGHHRGPEVVLEEEDEGADEDGSGSTDAGSAQQPWQQQQQPLQQQKHEATTAPTSLQLSRLELVDVRADMGLPSSLSSPILPSSPELPSPASAPAAAPDASPSAASTPACSGASAAVSSSASSVTRSCGTSGSGAADVESHTALVPSCLALRWRSGRRRTVEHVEERHESASPCGTSGCRADVGGAPDLDARHRSPLKAAFRRLTTVMRKSLRSRTTDVVDTTAAAATAPQDYAVHLISPTSSVPSAPSTSYCSYGGPHASSASAAAAAAAACESSLLSELPELGCRALPPSIASVSAPTGIRVRQLPREGPELLLSQRGSNQSDSSACCSAVTFTGSGLSCSSCSTISSSVVTSCISGCTSAGHDCLAYNRCSDSRGNSGSSSGGVGVVDVPRPAFTRGRSSETLHKVLGGAQSTALATALPAATGAVALLPCQDADAPAMAAAAARMLHAAMRARCSELPGGRIAQLCGQPKSACDGPSAKSLRAKSGFVTPVPAALAFDEGASAVAAAVASDVPNSDMRSCRAVPADAPCERLQMMQGLTCATDAEHGHDKEPCVAVVPGPYGAYAGNEAAALQDVGSSVSDAVVPEWTAAASEVTDAHASRPLQIPIAALSSASFTSSSATASAAAAAVFGEGCSRGGSRAGSLEACTLDRASLSEPGMLSRLELPRGLQDSLQDGLDGILEQ